MFVSLHQHLLDPSDDVEHSAYQPRVQTASSGSGKMLMHEKSCVIFIFYGNLAY